MSTERQQRIKELFFATVDLDAAGRDSFLARQCGGDHDLLREVRSLLEHDHDHDDAFSEGQLGIVREAIVDAVESGATPATGEAAPSRSLPERIGKYRILSLIGEGGMGLVYEAQQEQPKRTVALKVIRPGFASRSLLRRFQQESDVLGRLQHVGIAHIYDAGMAESGGASTGSSPQPYFAMELVRGDSVTAYAKNRDLRTDQRLSLIADVCDAVQHAHQKGIIHRDLKPGNILVDATGQPKILDFGVARLTNADARTMTMRTGVGELIGTVPYMSPEQVLGDPTQLDTRTDVYALGAILFELLTGRLPHDLAGRSIPEAARIIRDDEPSRAASVNPTLRGDIDTIVSKALEKDRDHRYASAEALALDIRRFLRDEPIVARPASTVYQLRKFAKRNRVLVGGVAAVFFVLVGGVAVSTVLAIRATRAEQQARENLNDAVAARTLAEQRQTEAQRQTEIAQAVNDFLNNDLLGSVDPSRNPDRQLTVREVLDTAADKIEGRFAGQPLVEAAIRTTLGMTYLNLGEHEAATAHLAKSLDLRSRHLGADDPQTLLAKSHVAQAYTQRGQYPEAENLFLQVLAAQERILGKDHHDTAITMTDLAGLYGDWGRKRDEALRLAEQALIILRAHFGDDHSETMNTLNTLANAQYNLGNYAASESFLRQALEGERRLLGAEHPTTLRIMTNLGYICDSQGKYPDAEELYDEALNIQRRVLGDDHPSTLETMNNLALLYQGMNRLDEARSLHEKTLAIRKRVLGEKHPYTLTSMGNLAQVLADQKNYAESESLYQQTIALQREVLSDENPSTLACMNNFALMYRQQGRHAKAEALFRETFEIQRRTLGETHRSTLISMQNLAHTIYLQGRLADADEIFATAEELAQSTFAEDDSFFGGFRLRYGQCLTRLERYRDAEEQLLASHALVIKIDGAMSRRPRVVADALVELYEAWNKPKEAATWRGEQLSGETHRN